MAPPLIVTTKFGSWSVWRKYLAAISMFGVIRDRHHSTSHNHGDLVTVDRRAKTSFQCDVPVKMVHGETRSVTIVSVLRPIIPSLLRGFALFSLSFILLSLLNHHRHTAYDVHLLSTDTSETRTSFPQYLVLRFIYCQWPICHCRYTSR